MPVFIGDVLESCGGPILDLSGNKVKGFGVFDSVGSRNDLDVEFQTLKYLSVVDGDLEVYSGTTWGDASNWTKIASEFSLYDSISVGDETNNSQNRATQFVLDTLDDGDRYSFGVFDSEDNDFNKVSGEDLKNIIIHYFGQELASFLQSETGNTDAFYTDSNSGLFGDINGDGIVSTSDILELLSGFGNTSSSVERNYTIAFGRDAFTPQSSADDLSIFFPYENGGLFAGGGYNSWDYISGWNNNTGVIAVNGASGGDDIAFISDFQQQSYIKIYRDPPPGGNFNNDDVVADNMYAWAQNVTAKVVAGTQQTEDGIYGSANAVFDGVLNLELTIRCYDGDGDLVQTSSGTNYLTVGGWEQEFEASDDINLQLIPGTNSDGVENIDLAAEIVDKWNAADQINEIRITPKFVSNQTGSTPSLTSGAISEITIDFLGIKVSSVE